MVKTSAVPVEAMLSVNDIVLFLVFHGCGHKPRTYGEMRSACSTSAKSMRALQHAIFTEAQANSAFGPCLFVHFAQCPAPKHPSRGKRFSVD